MKLLIVFSFINFLLITKAYEIHQIPGIENISYVKQIEFDYSSNTYVVTRSGGESNYDRLFKLDNSNTITLTQDFYLIWKILINSKNDVYIFSSESQPDYGQYCVHLLKSDSKEATFLFKFYFEPKFDYLPIFIDSDDYIFLNMESGAAFLRPDQNIPMAVNNLEHWYFDQHVDVAGNIILASTTTDKNPLVGFGKADKENNVITATFFPWEGGIIKNFRYWNNISIVFGEYYSGNRTTVRTLSSGLLLSQYNVNYTFYEGTNERFIFLSRYSTHPVSYQMGFITKDNRVVKIEEDLNSSITGYVYIYTSDRNGNFFIPYEEETQNGTEFQILLLRADEVTLRRIRIPTETKISSLMVDESDNLWILAGELFVVLKGTEEAVLVSGSMLTESEPLQLKLKKGTDQIFIGTYKALFVCTYSQ